MAFPNGTPTPRPPKLEIMSQVRSKADRVAAQVGPSCRNPAAALTWSWNVAVVVKPLRATEPKCR